MASPNYYVYYVYYLPRCGHCWPVRSLNAHPSILCCLIFRYTSHVRLVILSAPVTELVWSKLLLMGWYIDLPILPPTDEEQGTLYSLFTLCMHSVFSFYTMYALCILFLHYVCIMYSLFTLCMHYVFSFYTMSAFCILCLLYVCIMYSLFTLCMLSLYIYIYMQHNDLNMTRIGRCGL